MRFSELKIPGAYLIEIEPHQDERGFFARTFCAREFGKHDLDATIAQCSTSFNARRGTLRGIHYQTAPFAETKVVRCTAGAIFDVIVDLRVGAASYGSWTSAELSAANRKMIYLPEGVAHGFQTLTDDAEVLYQISTEFVAEASRGIHWNDPHLSIPWPIRDGMIVSSRDQAFPTMSP